MHRTFTTLYFKLLIFLYENRIIRRLFSVAGTALLTTISLTSAEPKEDTIYYPTRVGDKWTYVVSSASGKIKDFELTEEVVSVKDKEGITSVVVGRWYDGKLHPNRERQISDKGVWQTHNAAGEKYETPWIHLKLPHKPGQSWHVELIDQTMTAQGPEKIKVPAGTYEAIRVESRLKGNKSDPVQTDWYAREIGVIKATAGDTTMVMKSFTPGKN